MTLKSEGIFGRHISSLPNELPRRKRGVSEHRDENFTPCVTPECFDRGSTLLTTTLSKPSKGRGSSPDFSWIPSATVLWRNAGMTDFEKIWNRHYAASCGELDPQRLKRDPNSLILDRECRKKFKGDRRDEVDYGD